MTIEQTVKDLTQAIIGLTDKLERFNINPPIGEQAAVVADQSRSLNSSPDEYEHVAKKPKKEKAAKKKEKTENGILKKDLIAMIKTIINEGHLDSEQVKHIILEETGQDGLANLTPDERVEVEKALNEKLHEISNVKLDSIAEKVDNLAKVGKDLHKDDVGNSEENDFYSDIEEVRETSLEELNKTLKKAQTLGLSPYQLGVIAEKSTSTKKKLSMTGEQRYLFNQAVLKKIEDEHGSA